MKKTSRRELLQWLGGAAGVGLSSTLLMADSQPGSSMLDKLQQLPWPYAPLDARAVAERAFVSYSRGHCMYATAEAILGTVADRLGAPYTSFPFMMFKYGVGGINGWGTVCGAASGCAAAFQMLSPHPEPLIDALFSWYESEPLPNFLPKGAKYPECRSVSGVPLCHASVSSWCKKFNKRTDSPERKERCGTLAASVALKAVELLNEQAALKPVVHPGQTQSCLSCHERGGVVENIRGKMQCGSCHDERLETHPAKLRTER